jgi:hypothetical protein
MFSLLSWQFLSAESRKKMWRVWIFQRITVTLKDQYKVAEQIHLRAITYIEFFIKLYKLTHK